MLPPVEKPFWQWKREQYAKDQAARTPRTRHQYYADYGRYCNKERSLNSSSTRSKA
jgi:hypothetical protein